MPRILGPLTVACLPGMALPQARGGGECGIGFDRSDVVTPSPEFGRGAGARPWRTPFKRNTSGSLSTL